MDQSVTAANAILMTEQASPQKADLPHCEKVLFIRRAGFPARSKSLFSLVIYILIAYSYINDITSRLCGLRFDLRFDMIHVSLMLPSYLFVAVPWILYPLNDPPHGS